MPIAAWVKNLFQDRVELVDFLTPEEVETLVDNKNLKVLQCSSPVETTTWDLLNEQFFTRRPEVELRLYGFYSQVCDLSFTARMGNVRHFLADCLMDASGLENIAAMEKLEKLCISIYHLDRFDFLKQVTPDLKKLQLGRTRSKKPDLSLISRFQTLEGIYIEGQHKNIEVLSQLLALQDVNLRSLSTPDISYLKPLQRMWSLRILLGGITNLNAIQGMENIKYLELWQVKGLSDLEVIASLKGLQFLVLQSLPQVNAIPSLNRLNKLRRIILDNMKGLLNLDSILTAPELEEFMHINAQNMQPADYEPLLQRKNLKQMVVHFGSARKENRMHDLLIKYKKDLSPGFKPFEYDH